MIINSIVDSDVMAIHRNPDRGKMNKWETLKRMIHGVDVVVEVLDARDIPGTRLPLAEKWAGSKRLLVIVNKKDLLPQGKRIPKLQNRGISMSAKDADENGRWKVLHEILSRTEQRPARALFIGYPNVGKSTLINLLARRKAARVSAVAGTTRDIQWVKVNDDLIISDYRGMFPSEERKEDLVMKGALNIQGYEDIYAHKFAEKILVTPVLKRWLEREYDINLKDAKHSEDVLRIIAERRKWYLKGGEPNLEEAAKNLVRKMAEAPQI